MKQKGEEQKKDKRREDKRREEKKSRKMTGSVKIKHGSNTFYFFY